MSNRRRASGVGGRKIKRSFNFIDVLLILFVMAIIFVAINVVSPMSLISKLKGEDSYDIEYTVELVGVDSDFIDSVKEGDTVVDAVSKNSIGSVKSVDYNNRYTELEYDDTKAAGVVVEYEDKLNVLITVSASATYNEGKGYAVNERRIAVGEKLSLRFPDFAGEGYCVGFSAAS